MRSPRHLLRSSSRQLGPLEQQLLERIWARGSATVRELAEDEFQEWAYTTVMSTLDRLFKKGLLSRTTELRAYRFAPQLSAADLHRDAADEAFRKLLDANPRSPLPMSFLVDIICERDPKLLDDLLKIVEAKRRNLRSKERQQEGK